MAASLFVKEISSILSRCTENSIRLAHFKRNFARKMENLESNPYFGKYADKIRVLQQNKPEEFSARVEQVKMLKDGRSKEQERGFSDVTCPKELRRPDPSYRKEQKLDDVMKVELIRDKSLAEISEIWSKYHRTKDRTIAAIIPAPVYSLIVLRSQQFPTFVYPLPRRQGYEFILAQFCGHECHFTSLINYQAYKENAPECLTIVHYAELQQEKEIVLMRGEYDEQILSGTEAQCLANQVQLYYTSPPGSQKFNLLKTFNTDSSEFKYSALIEQLQNVDLPEKPQG